MKNLNKKQKNIVIIVTLIVIIIMTFILYNAITFKSQFYTLTNETCISNGGNNGLYNECVYNITDANLCKESGGYMREIWSEPKYNVSTNDFNQDIEEINCVAYYGSSVRFK